MSTACALRVCMGALAVISRWHRSTRREAVPSDTRPPASTHSRSHETSSEDRRTDWGDERCEMGGEMIGVERDDRRDGKSDEAFEETRGAKGVER